MCFATRCDRASPCPGVNHGRTRHAPVELDGPRLDRAAAGDGAARPELPRTPACSANASFSAPSKANDDVFLPSPGVLGPVHRAGPHVAPVADAELVMHEVGDPRRFRASRRGAPRSPRDASRAAAGRGSGRGGRRCRGGAREHRAGAPRGARRGRARRPPARDGRRRARGRGSSCASWTYAAICARDPRGRLAAVGERHQFDGHVGSRSLGGAD